MLIVGQILLSEWSKYRYGVFPETGFNGDQIYPRTSIEGNETLLNVGCPQPDPFCPLGQHYNRFSPTKQNLLCNGASAIETILSHPDFNQEYHNKKKNTAATTVDSIFVTPNQNESTTTTVMPPLNFMEFNKIGVKAPTFRYIVPKQNKYVVLLDRTSVMGINSRWVNVKRAFYRFISYLPVGTELSIVTFGSRASLNLPPTIVTDQNREGLHGRIPRKVLDNDDFSCVNCALNASIQNLAGKGGHVILITGSPRRPGYFDQLTEQIRETPISFYPVIYPRTAYSELVNLAVYGKQYAVPETENVNPLLNEALLDILKLSGGIQVQKVHHQSMEDDLNSLEFGGTFTMEEEILHKMSVTLSIDDEEQVEFFEIINPSGKKHLFSKFEDGMVIFNHPSGFAQAGIWSYHAKLYPSNNKKINKMSVDVIGQRNDEETEPVTLTVFTNKDHATVDAYNDQLIIYAKLSKGASKPVIRASLKARVYRPGNNEPVEIELRDNGLGYPDVTGDDGIYSAYFSDFAGVPGFYSIQVEAHHNDGLARTPKSRPLINAQDGPFYGNYY